MVGRREAGVSGGRVAVLSGGDSPERAISLASGEAVLEALRRVGRDAQCVDPAQIDDGAELLSQLSAAGYEQAFIALHGGDGENGALQGALESVAIPYTGSGVLGAALAMDKWRSKWLWSGLGMLVPDGELLREGSDWGQLLERFSGSAVVKPSDCGSSIGVRGVESAEEMERAWCEAHRYSAVVLAEEWVRGGEYTVGIIGERALPVVRIVHDAQCYDFDAKYRDQSTELHCPSGLSASQESAAQALGLAAFEALGCSGWGRVDLLREDPGRGFLLLEVNTVPGMTEHSLLPLAARNSGIDFDQLVLSVLATAGRGAGR